MKNILVIAQEFDIGGLETNIKTTIENCSNINFYFALSNYSKKIKLTNVSDQKFVFAKNSTVKDFIEDVNRLVELIKDKKIDLIHVHPFYSFFPAMIASQLTNTPIVYHYHGHASYSFPELDNSFVMQTYFFDYLSHIFSVTEEGVKELTTKNQIENISFLPNSIDLKSFKPLKYQKNKKWALISRLDSFKTESIYQFLEIFDQLDIEQLDIYGDGDKQEELEKHLIKNNLDQKVKLRGRTNQVRKDLSKGYNGVIGIGRVIMEAIALKMPNMVIGRGKNSGLLTFDKYQIIKKQNFTNLELDDLTAKQINQEIKKINNSEINKIFQDFADNFSAQAVATEYQAIINKIIFKESLAIKPFYQRLLEIKDQNQLNQQFYASREVFGLFEQLIKKWNLSHNLKNDMFLLENHYQQQILKWNQDALIEQKSKNEQTINQLKAEIEEMKQNNKKRSGLRYKIQKIKTVIRRDGLFGFVKKTLRYIKARLWPRFNFINKINYKLHQKRNRARISQIFKDNDFERIVIWRSGFGWDVELFQRPQHISKSLSKNKTLVLYEVSKMTDQVDDFKTISENLVLINCSNQSFYQMLLEIIDKIDIPKYLQLYSTDWAFDVNQVKQYQDRGYKFIYEYIDDLSPALAGTEELPANITSKYNYALENEDVYIVTTADALYQDVLKKRGKKNLIFSTNGVDYQFFQSFDQDYQFESEFLKIVKNGKINLCYYGALATWFDYDLIKKINRTNQYNIILFGIKYDDSYDQSGIDKLENVYFMGARKYHVLKNYARKMDILMIPFLINDITKATSPVKLFEYMALKKPIITTMLPECQKYKSVITAKKEDFIDNLKIAYKNRNDKKYIKLLDKEAQQNSWDYKAKAIVDVIKKDEK